MKEQLYIKAINKVLSENLKAGRIDMISTNITNLVNEICNLVQPIEQSEVTAEEILKKYFGEIMLTDVIPILKAMEEYAAIKSQSLPISKIRAFIERQRRIGEHRFAKKLRTRYNKKADEFYKQFADKIYYKDKEGNEIRLDIMTIWWFRTNEWLLESQSLPKEELYPKEFVLYMSGDKTSKGTRIEDWYEHWLKEQKNEK